jgi:aminomethyltransferase
MGEIIISGPKAEDFLRSMIPTRLDKLAPGKSMYSCLCSERGGIIDDLFVYMMSDVKYYLVVNASTLEKDYRWMRDHSIPGVEIKDVSAVTAKIDLQGPLSKGIARVALKSDALENLERFGFTETSFHGGPLMVSQSGYTGEFGYEFYLPAENGAALWRALLEAGRPEGLLPCGLGSRDSLRLESCYSLYGHELDEKTTPMEGGIGWIVSSQAEYVGREVLERQKSEGAPLMTLYFEVTEKGIPREGCPVLRSGLEIGRATSAGYSPTLKKGIGIARVKTGSVAVGDAIEVIVREKPLKARITERPFYKYNSL